MSSGEKRTPGTAARSLAFSTASTLKRGRPEKSAWCPGGLPPDSPAARTRPHWHHHLRDQPGRTRDNDSFRVILGVGRSGNFASVDGAPEPAHRLLSGSEQPAGPAGGMPGLTGVHNDLVHWRGYGHGHSAQWPGSGKHAPDPTIHPLAPADLEEQWMITSGAQVRDSRHRSPGHFSPLSPLRPSTSAARRPRKAQPCPWHNQADEWADLRGT
ncbi:hypothetical protein QF036_002065 [Arthrobacter globiformis]|nr:hypothetical protein [Arthrobacter globiformis]